jgi:hypothetical protein
MKATPKSVTIARIELTTAIVGAVATAVLYICTDPTIAIGAAAGCAFIVVNLFLLAIVGRGIIAAGRVSGSLSILGLLLIPLKLAFFIGVSYVLVSRLGINPVAFVLGVLTQPVAMLIEVWRAAPSSGVSLAQSQFKGNQV